MFKRFLLAGFCFLTIIFGFANNTWAQETENYLCKAQDIGYSSDKITIEFPYQKGLDKAIQNLYIKITKTGNGNSGIWDALYSTDADFNYWTTPVLRDVAIGIEPLVIVQRNGTTPPNERLEADFYSKTYKIKCTVLM